MFPCSQVPQRAQGGSLSKPWASVAQPGARAPTFPVFPRSSKRTGRLDRAYGSYVANFDSCLAAKSVGSMILWDLCILGILRIVSNQSTCAVNVNVHVKCRRAVFERNARSEHDFKRSSYSYSIAVRALPCGVSSSVRSSVLLSLPHTPLHACSLSLG